MADTKLSALTELGAAADPADLLYLLSDPAGTPLDKSCTVAHLLSGYAQLTDIATGTITARADDVDLSGGSDGDVLTVQADGSLALETPAAAGVDTSGTPADNQIAVFTDADTIEGSSALIFGATNEGLHITSGATTTIPCKIKLASGQTANAIEINSNAGSGGDIAAITAGGAMRVGNGSVSAPSLSFAGDTDTGFYLAAAGYIRISAGGSALAQFAGGGSTKGLQLASGDRVNFGDSVTGTKRAAIKGTTSDELEVLVSLSDTVVGKFDNNATAGNTRLLIWDVDNNQLERVSVGAADSGGTGYKVLRIAN